jgi:hypothetical protein
MGKFLISGHRFLTDITKEIRPEKTLKSFKQTEQLPSKWNNETCRNGWGKPHLKLALASSILSSAVIWSFLTCLEATCLTLNSSMQMLQVKTSSDLSLAMTWWVKVWPEATFSSQIGQGRASDDDVTAKAAAAMATAAAEIGGPPPSDFYEKCLVFYPLS